MAFSGLTNHIVVVNAFEMNIIHRIELGVPEKYVKIYQSFITNSKDLFVMVYMDKQYQLFKFDLDLSHIKNCNEIDKMRSEFM